MNFYIESIRETLNKLLVSVFALKESKEADRELSNIINLLDTLKDKISNFKDAALRHRAGETIDKVYPGFTEFEDTLANIISRFKVLQEFGEEDKTETAFDNIQQTILYLKDQIEYLIREKDYKIYDNNDKVVRPENVSVEHFFGYAASKGIKANL